MYKLKPAEFSEYAAIAALHTASWQNTYRGIMSETFLSNEVQSELLKMWYDRLRSPRPNQVVTLAVEEDTIVGFSCIYIDDEPAYGTLLDNLHISKRSQKSGIGKLLMKNCAAVILERGKSHNMYLWVFEANQPAKQFYEQLNGKNLETINKTNIDGTEANVCRYVWENVNSLI